MRDTADDNILTSLQSSNSRIVDEAFTSLYDLAFDAIASVEPGGHFFGCDHTMARFETAFYEPLVSDRDNFGLWTEKGARTAAVRANEIWKRVLADFELPPMDPGRREAVEQFVRRRISEGGAPPS